MNNTLILIGGISLLVIGLLVTYIGKKKGKGRRVTVKHPGIWEQIFGKPRKIIIPERHMLVEYRRPSTREVWFETRPKPDDGKFQNDELEKTIFLDGKLSDNGGNHVTIDADLGVQVGFAIGLVAVAEEYEEDVVVLVDGQQVVQKQKGIRMKAVETREFVGLDGTQTWINEHDVSFKQISLANTQDQMKTMKLLMQICFVCIVVVSIVAIVSSFLNYQVADAAGLINGLGGK